MYFSKKKETNDLSVFSNHYGIKLESTIKRKV